MSSNPNLFTLNPKFFQTSINSYYTSLNADEFSSTKSVWSIEKTQFQEKIQNLENELKTQKEINKRLTVRIQELEALISRSKAKDHQRVYSIPSTYGNASPQNILNTLLLGFSDHRPKQTPFISSKYMENFQKKKEEKVMHNKENENETVEKRKLHHQKSNSFNTNSLLISENANHEQKDELVQEGANNQKILNTRSRHLFQQKNIRKKTPTNFESNSNSTNLSNSNISQLSGISTHDVKIQPEKNSNDTQNQAKDRLSFLTNEKSIEFPSKESNELMKGNVANSYIFLSPAQRQKLINIPLKRRWTVSKSSKQNNIQTPPEKTLIKDTPMTKSAHNFAQIDKKGTHLYRQGIANNEFRFLGRKKQYPQFILKGHLDGVRNLAITDNQNYLVSASEDRSLKLWDIKEFEKKNDKNSMEPFCTLRGHAGPVFALATPRFFLQNSLYQDFSNYVFSAGSEGIINLWKFPDSDAGYYNSKTEDRIFCHYFWKAHDDCIWDINCHSLFDILASSSSDGKIKLWKTINDNHDFEINSIEPKFDHNLLGTFSYLNDIPTTHAFIDGSMPSLCSGYAFSKNLILFDYIEKKEIKTVLEYESTENDARTNKILFNAEFNCLLTAHEDKNIRMFDLNSNKVLKTFTAHNDSVTSLTLNPNNNNQIISVSHDASLRIWDIRKFQCLQELLIHRKKYDEAAHCVISHKNLPYIFTGGADSCIKVLKSI